MNKWLLRLFGLLVLGVLTIIFYDAWFHPPVPQVLQEEISLQVGDRVQGTTQSQTSLSQTNDNPDGSPTIELTSLEGNNEPAVLSNPQTPPEPVQTTQPVEETQTAEAQQPPVASTTTTLPAEQPSSPTQDSAPTQDKVWIQVGSFADVENADKMVAKMSALGWSTDIAIVNINGQNYHRVFVGPLAATDTEHYLSTLSGMGISARKVKR